MAAAPEPDRHAQLKLVASVMVPAWGRAVVVLVGTAALLGAVGLGEQTGYAIIPGIFMALSPPAGRVWSRVGTVTVATGALAALAWVGAELSRSPWAVVVGLLVAGFGAGVLPRVGPRCAALQLPLLVGFAYSVAFPLSQDPSLARVAAFGAAWPVYVVAVALLFQPDSRRALRLGAAAAFAEVGHALRSAAAGEADAEKVAEAGAVKFRVASARLNDAALPVDRSTDSGSARLLLVAVQQSITATELHVLTATGPDDPRHGRAQALGLEAEALARSLSGAGPTPSPENARVIRAEAVAAGDASLALLADSVADASAALSVQRRETTDLPPEALSPLPGPLRRLRAALTPSDPIFRRAVRLAVAAGLAGLVAESLDLTRTYWAVFAAVVVLNAPPARNRARALMRIGGTVAGFALAIALLAIVGDRPVVAFVVAIVVLLPGLMLMPINYAGAVCFITCTVSMFYSATGEESDFLRFRVVDNAVGVAVVLLVGLLMWRVSRDDWWQTARLTVEELATTASSADPLAHRDDLAVRALQLRGETVDVAAIPGAPRSFLATWTFVAAAEDLIRALVGPQELFLRSGRHEEDPTQRSELARRLRALAEQCRAGDREAIASVSAGPPGARQDMDLLRMSGAVAQLHRAGVEQ